MNKKSDNRESLFGEFPPVYKKEWKDQVIKDLKGKDFNKLIWKTYENIYAEPFYTEEDLDQISNQLKSNPGEFPYVRGSSSKNNDWKINQEINQKDIELANKLAIKSLNSGADSITFDCTVSNGTFLGIPIQSKDDISSLLNDIDIETIPIHFKGGEAALGILALYSNEARRRNINLENLSGSVDCDPLGDLCVNGVLSKGEADAFGETRELISYLGNNIPNLKGLKVNSETFNNSGASITQELAFTVSSGVEYLDRLTEMDFTIDQISEQMVFCFSIGSNYFMEIAKLRAARLLWSQIVDQYEPKNESSKLMQIEVQNSSWNKTQFDPFVNLLRGTVETMAGALGGAGSITARPLDAEYKTPDEFSLRMSRNTQLILKNESYLERVADPSAGSYYIENLTNSIATESWRLFQEIEGNGGFVESLKTGAIQNAIEETRKSRDINIATRKDIFLGVNQYPNSNEDISSEIEQPKIVNADESKNKLEAKNKLSIEDLCSYLSGEDRLIGDTLFKSNENSESTISKLQPYRGAQAFEELRLATERNHDKTGYKPKVFLLTIGNPSMRTARASFSSNFFGCAGFEVINNIGFDTPQDGIESAFSADADIVVICSSDDEYTQFTATIINGLRENKPDVKVIIAGNPKAHIEELENAGVDDFIHVRSNALEMLSKYQDILGIHVEDR